MSAPIAHGLPLEARLGRLIDATGPIPLATYMAECNAHYYATRDPLGSHGDFITAPEISQMFGEMIGLACADLWLRAGKPEGLAYVELGPGRGTLAADAVRTMAQFGFLPPVHFVETSPVLQTLQLERLPMAMLHDSVEDLPGDYPLIIIANEFFDALPIRQLIATHSGWREQVVARTQGRFITMPGVIPMDSAVPRHLHHQPPGTIIEIAPTRNAVMQALAARLAQQGGALLAIDYGYKGPKTGSSFQAVRGHAHADPFAAPGETDLTAHVDFAALAESARAGGVRVYGPVDQGIWLQRLGLKERAEALSAAAPGRAPAIASEAERLANPAAMGRLFQVMGAAHPGWPQPEGFAEPATGGSAGDSQT